MICQCSVCSKQFEVSLLYKKMVEAKKIPIEDVLCGGCSGEHDDGAIVPEKEEV